jgi:hypothetical protein
VNLYTLWRWKTICQTSFFTHVNYRSLDMLEGGGEIPKSNIVQQLSGTMARWPIPTCSSQLNTWQQTAHVNRVNYTVVNYHHFYSRSTNYFRTYWIYFFTALSSVSFNIVTFS